MTCLTMLQHFYVHMINRWQLTNHQAIGYLQNLLEYNGSRGAYLNFKGKQQSLQLKQGFSMKTVTMDISFKLQHLKQISEFSETLFPSRLQAGYHVNRVPDGSWVHRGEVLKEKWSGELSDKCATVIYVWKKELHSNVRLNQTVRLIIL